MKKLIRRYRIHDSRRVFFYRIRKRSSSIIRFARSFNWLSTALEHYHIPFKEGLISHVGEFTRERGYQTMKSIIEKRID